MQIYKFGGASVKDAQAIKSLKQIILQVDKSTVVVISAIGKTTNKLEKILSSFISKSDIWQSLLDQLFDHHITIATELIKEPDEVIEKIKGLKKLLLKQLEQFSSLTYGKLYDAIVSYGELLSTTIISEYLSREGVSTTFLDVRSVIITDSTFRAAKVDWVQTEARIKKFFKERQQEDGIVVTQGFIAGNMEGRTTTLGREGSDYTAAIFGAILDAECVTVWKDVEGIFNADPTIFPQAVKLDRLSYKEMIELAYYGAKVIHPSTIKPLQNKNITLVVRSFKKVDALGTIILDHADAHDTTPFYIVKENQLLITLSTTDLSFFNEKQLSKVFAIAGHLNVQINMIQNTAVTLSICVDNDFITLPELLKRFGKEFVVKYNEGLTLFTVRHYKVGYDSSKWKGRKVLLEQKSRYTLQQIIK